MTETTLNQQIQQFYDASSRLWEKVWGEHMHHGYYGTRGEIRKPRRQAQIDLIDALLQWSQVQSPQNILDVGCGIGGSTLDLANRYNAKATGITLSPVQVNRAQERSQIAGLTEKCDFQVADAMAMPFDDNTFDLVWSLESGEHMSDKAQFLRECYRVGSEGGTILIVTWCHRPTDAYSGELTPSEKRHLEQIYRVYHLPGVISLPEYQAIAQEIGYKNIRTADWSAAVAPFWDVVVASALDPAVLWELLLAGSETWQGAGALPLMQKGYSRGLIRFGLLCAQK